MITQEVWTKRGLCVGSKTAQAMLFSTNEHDRKLASEELCAHCPVRPDCEEFGHRTAQNYGVWGGVDFENRNIPHTVICENPKCGNPFQSERRNATYCNSKCRQEAYRARMAAHATAMIGSDRV